MLLNLCMEQRQNNKDNRGERPADAGQRNETPRQGNPRGDEQRHSREGNPRNEGQRQHGQRENGNRENSNREGGNREHNQREGGQRENGQREGGHNNRHDRHRNHNDQRQHGNKDGQAREDRQQRQPREDRQPADERQQQKQPREERVLAEERTEKPVQQERQPQDRQQQDRQQQKQAREERQPADDRQPREDRQQRQPREDRQPANDRQPREDRHQEREEGLQSLRDMPNVESQRQASVLAKDQPANQERLVIGISLGDYNGIGPEVILKALQHNRMQRLCTPVIYGSMRVLNRYRNVLNLKDWNLNGIQHIGQASHKLTNVITCWSDQAGTQPGQPPQEIQPGKVTPEAGQAAFACLQRGVEDLKAGKLDALITAPINKYNIQSDDFKFPGHTEYLAEAAGAADSLMFLVSDYLRVGVVTGHIPLGEVKQAVTREKIQQKLSLMMQSLKLDFGIAKPKIAVLGLNPHAGEEGLLGNEENEIIRPLINDLRQKGQLVYGPFAADGFFGTRSYKKFDAVLAMYHDQGLIPFKTIAFDEGVNFTAGLPFIRTSPDHGTAYDIAGKGIADETSMVQAIYLACDVARKRKEHQELEANKLQKQTIEK